MAAPPRDPPTEPAEPPSRPFDVCVKLADAGRALRYLATLAAADRQRDAEVLRAGPAWWIRARVELDLARAAAQATGGRVHLHRDGRLFADRGIGAPQTVRSAGVPLASLAASTVVDLVLAARLHPAAASPVRDVAVLLPGLATAEFLRRAVDLGLDVWHRPVRLHPLSGPECGDSAMMEVTIRARAPGHVPSGLLAFGARLPLSVVCRRVGDGGRLLVQHATALPIADFQLASLLDAEHCVVADQAFGCWRLEPLADHQPGVALAATGAGFTPENQQPLGTHTDVAPIEIRVVPSRRPGQRVDAVLLDDVELELVPLLLERHPLAEAAMVARGRDRHLLLAPGGLLDDISLGTQLACIGPGPLYLPIGHRISPELPPAARQSLLMADDRHAVVLTDGRALHFPRGALQPVWHLWAAAAPAVDLQLPAETLAALAGAEPTPEHDGAASPGARPDPMPRLPTAAPGAWRAEALRAELDNDLARAADLHRRHNEPLRAAHLYERLATLRDAGRSVSVPPSPTTPEGPP